MLKVKDKDTRTTPLASKCRLGRNKKLRNKNEATMLWTKDIQTKDMFRSFRVELTQKS